MSFFAMSFGRIQSDDDNFMTSLSLIGSKDKNIEFDTTSKLTSSKQLEDKARPATFLQIYRFAKKEQKYFWIGFFSVLLQSAAWPLYTILYGLLFRTLSEAINSKGREELESQNVRNGLLFLGLGVFGGVFRFTSGALFGYIGEVVSEKMKIAVFKNILRQDGSFFDTPENSSGNLMTRLSSDAPNVQSAIDERLCDILQGFCTLIYGCMFAFYFNWRMTLIEIGIVGLLCLIQVIMLEVLKRQKMRDSQLSEDAIKIAAEAIGQVRTVQSLNKQQYFHSAFCKALSVPYSRAAWSSPLQAAVFGLGSCCEELNFIFSYLAGLLMIKGGHASPFIVFQVIENIDAGLIICGITFAAYVPYYSQALASAGLIFKMMNKISGIDSMDEQGKKPEIEGNVKMKNVEFAYPRSQNHLVLKGLNLEAFSGKSLALVGPSGSGKTTIISLMERFYDIQKGEISLDNNDIQKLNIRHLRKNIALVGQEPTLFNLSIEENISYGLDTTQEEIINAAKMANIHNFVISLPKGYQTMLGSRGMQLSGGQRQRISIARAIVRNPKILLLDEATSSLDTQSEKLVQESLERASHGRTSITIAHRLSTIQHADVIAVVKDGRIVEQGSHQQLLNQKGLYYKLLQKQLTKN